MASVVTSIRVADRALLDRYKARAQQLGVSRAQYIASFLSDLDRRLLELESSDE